MLVFVIVRFFVFKQKTAYEMRISDWSSDVCSSDLFSAPRPDGLNIGPGHEALGDLRIVFPFEKNARGGEAIGELREPVHRWQIGDVVGNDERLDLLARGQGRSIARVVIDRKSVV